MAGAVEQSTLERFRMAGVQQVRAETPQPERPRGVLLEFPAGRSSPVPAPSAEASEAGLQPTAAGIDADREPVAEIPAAPISPGVLKVAKAETAEAAPLCGDAGSTLAPVEAGNDQSAPGQVGPPRPRKNWFQRLLRPDRAERDKRQAARNQSPGLIAHFWTGGAPQAHPVRDISVSGLYVITTERWYLGTQIRVTLTRSGPGDPKSARTITVQAVALRWGADGVGLAFIPKNEWSRQTSLHAPIDGADARQLQQFVETLQLPEPGVDR